VDPANESLDAPAGGAGLRVVLIDDNVDSVDALSMLLELEGHAVQVACDGAAGLALIESVGPDVVLCDIGLPGLDGFEAARAARAARRMVRVPLLVAISGYAQPGDAARLPN
jgi:CheY-like chemotaxis protein